MDFGNLPNGLYSPVPLWLLLLGVLLALLCGFLPAWLRLRALRRKVDEEDARVATLEAELASRVDRLHDAQTRLAVAEERAGRVLPLEERASRQARYIEDLRTEAATLKAQLESERKNLDEKLALVQKAEVQLMAHFDSVAQRILDEKSQKFTEQNRTQLDGLLTPFRDQLGDFRRKLDELHLHDNRDRASLRQEIENLRRETQRITEEAVSLGQALRGDRKLQGNWGEMVLERVLERSGLRKGLEYETQISFRDGERNLFRPDVIVRLPEGRDIVIDAKVSLVAYERCCALDDGPEWEAALRDHIRSVRSHIKTLAAKDYSALEGLYTPDFVLLFMPIEQAFRLAFQHDQRLFDDAFENRIVVVSPTTLLATLRTIENIWRVERRNENARLIADRAGGIYDKLRGMVEDLEKVGLQLSGAQRSYEAAMSKLSQGRGNLIGQAERLLELGVKVNRRLPKSILERAELDADPSGDAASAERGEPARG